MNLLQPNQIIIIYNYHIYQQYSTLGTNHPDYATVLNNFAGLYRLWKKLPQSEKYYLTAMETYRSTIGENHFLYISVCNNLGLLYQEQGETKKAHSLHIECLQKLMDSGNDLAVATTLNNLAQVYMTQKEYKKAYDHLLKAQILYRGLVGEKHPLYATTLNNLGAACYLTGDLDSAKNWYQSALEICMITYGSESPQTLEVKNMLRRCGALI